MTPPPFETTRRRWLLGAGALMLASPAVARQEPLPSPDGTLAPDPSGGPIEAIRRRAAEAGLVGLRSKEGERYVALGTARDDFVAGALGLCEGLADDFLGHFAERGFAVEPPADRMAMVALADPIEFAQFLGERPPDDVTGVYEVGPNYLVLYDGRNGGPSGLGIAAERANSITLFHEATHQLTFNTGLLRREAEIPLVVSEGLATYGEVRRPGGRTTVGAPNRERLGVLSATIRRGEALTPIEALIGDDGPFHDPDRVQRSYAQAWLFVSAMVRHEPARDRFRSYLAALGEVARPRDRVDLAREHLGDLGRLDEALHGYASRLLGVR